MQISFGGVFLWDDESSNLNYRGCAIDLPQVKPVSRPVVVIDPPLGDGKWLKSGQLENGSVSFKASWLLSPGKNELFSKWLAGFTGLPMRLLEIPNCGSWWCTLEPVEAIELQSFEEGDIMSATLNFTVYP